MIKKNEVSAYLSFFKFPKAFIFDDKYKNLSNTAKLMYMLLFGRLELSLKNGWHDTSGEVFQYYTNEQFMLDLNISKKTAIKAKKELAKVGLVIEVRQGMTLPNRIYLSPVVGSVINTTHEGEKVPVRSVTDTIHEGEKVHTNETDNNETDNNETDNNIMSSKDDTPYQEIIDYLNAKTGKTYQARSKDTRKHIRARYADGFRLDDFKKVIDNMSAKWLGTDWEAYLRPRTLFGTKFEDYLNQTVRKPSDEFSDPNAAKFAGMEDWN